ncbi:hypothetical protein PoB_002750000 [Plakobranchus ocellatus]|uniref:Uncharacterized protein n=1 Tax=Plakobranchus ocellatus TaxID=259542 RepID=A0AAV4A0R9_9GAST|nr:hypothetical protein PoB_002750000 [Plakobranchus ocellatus]
MRWLQNISSSDVLTTSHDQLSPATGFTRTCNPLNNLHRKRNVLPTFQKKTLHISPGVNSGLLVNLGRPGPILHLRWAIVCLAKANLRAQRDSEQNL